MTTVQFKLLDAVVFATTVIPTFAFFNMILGTRPLITEFEWGAIIGVTLLKTLDAFRSWMAPAVLPSGSQGSGK